MPVIPFSCPSPQEMEQDSRRAKGAPTRGTSSRRHQENIITSPLLDGRRDVLLVSSAARTSPRHSFCPSAILFRFLRRGTRKGLQTSYLFLVLKPTGLSKI